MSIINYNKKDDERDRSIFSLKIWAILLSLGAFAVLLYNAFTLNFWTDEANGYFLSKQPLDTLITLMFHNVHEDPPLFDIILHYWIIIAGSQVWMLRLLSILFWIGNGIGMFYAAKQLAGEKAAWASMLFLAIMPYHWLAPASLRWYSFFTCLAAWNFFLFLRLSNLPGNSTKDSHLSGKLWIRDMVPYVATAVAMWYTNYIALVFFFTQFIIIVLWAKSRLKLLKIMVLSWFFTLIFYLPWLLVFFRQFGESVGVYSFPKTILSFYVLIAGELSLPLNYWISIPSGVFGILTIYLCITQIKKIKIPFVVVLIILLSMMISGTSHVMRMLIVTPFIAVCYGIIFANIFCDKISSSLLRTALLAVLAGLMVIAGSFFNMAKRDGWLAYRWLDPYEKVVKSIKCNHPQGVILTKSPSSFFYLGDSMGILRFNNTKLFPLLPPQKLEGSDARAFFFLLDPQHPANRVLEDELSKGREVIVIHSGTEYPFSFLRPQLEEYLGKSHYKLKGVEYYLEMPPYFVTYHHNTASHYGERKLVYPEDFQRIVVMYFHK